VLVSTSARRAEQRTFSTLSWSSSNIIILLEGYCRGEEKRLALTSIYDVGFGSQVAKSIVYLVAAV
jgi:hypothetical protein